MRAAGHDAPLKQEVVHVAGATAYLPCNFVPLCVVLNGDWEVATLVELSELGAPLPANCFCPCLQWSFLRCARDVALGRVHGGFQWRRHAAKLRVCPARV